MNIVGILGSPSPVSRSGSLLRLAQNQLQEKWGTSVLRTPEFTFGAARQAHAVSYRAIAVRELPAEALLHAQFGHPLIRHALDAVAAADVVLVATPIYKAAYSGLLKAFLDLLPQDGLRGKTVLPLATGGSLAHLLAIDYALKPVLAALGARDILDAVYAVDAQIPGHETLGYAPAAELRERIDASLHSLNRRQRVAEAA